MQCTLHLRLRLKRTDKIRRIRSKSLLSSPQTQTPPAELPLSSTCYTKVCDFRHKGWIWWPGGDLSVSQEPRLRTLGPPASGLVLQRKHALSPAAFQRGERNRNISENGKQTRADQTKAVGQGRGRPDVGCTSASSVPTSSGLLV